MAESPSCPAVFNGRLMAVAKSIQFAFNSCGSRRAGTLGLIIQAANYFFSIDIIMEAHQADLVAQMCNMQVDHRFIFAASGRCWIDID
jgi:hypothetical protein